MDERGWRAQFTGGHLTTPDVVEPFVDVVNSPHRSSTAEASGTGRLL
jgi:hypothetical protein